MNRPCEPKPLDAAKQVFLSWRWLKPFWWRLLSCEERSKVGFSTPLGVGFSQVTGVWWLKSGEKIPTWDGAQTLFFYWDKLPSPQLVSRISEPSTKTTEYFEGETFCPFLAPEKDGAVPKTSRFSKENSHKLIKSIKSHALLIFFVRSTFLPTKKKRVGWDD